MESEVTYGDIEVEITLNAADLLALERDGEILAHPADPADPIGIVTDDATFDAYEEEADATAIKVSSGELMDLARGDLSSLSWTCGRAGTREEPLVRLYLE